MKKIIVLFGILSLAACTTNCKRDPDEPRASMKRVERNAGEIVEEGNKGIKRGVDAMDKTWETPKEQREKGYPIQPDTNR